MIGFHTGKDVRPATPLSSYGTTQLQKTHWKINHGRWRLLREPGEETDSTGSVTDQRFRRQDKWNNTNNTQNFKVTVIPEQAENILAKEEFDLGFQILLPILSLFEHDKTENILPFGVVQRTVYSFSFGQ